MSTRRMERESFGEKKEVKSPMPPNTHLKLIANMFLLGVMDCSKVRDCHNHLVVLFIPLL